MQTMVLNVYMQGGVLTGILNEYAVAGRGDGVGDSDRAAARPQRCARRTRIDVYSSSSIIRA